MPLVTQAVAVNTTATQLFPFAAASGGAKRISVTNAGPNPIHIGAAGVTTSNGFKIAAGGSFSLSPGIINGPIFAIAETALQVSPADTRVMVEVSD